MPSKLPTYWKRYDFIYKNYSKKELFKFLKKKCKAHGLPYKKKDNRGRKPKFTSLTYTAYLCLQKIFRHRYREMELEATLYLSDKADHSTFARNYNKIEDEYIEKLVASLVNKEFIFWIADSTHMSSKIRSERTKQGLRNKILLRDKYHVVCGYDPPTNCVQILGVKATDNHVSDSGGAIKIMENMTSRAYFLGDAAYNSYELHEAVKNVGLYPLIKPGKRRVRRGLSVKAANVKLFSKKLYKEIRGIVETIFGGATNAGLILSYAKKEHTRRLDTLMLALRHNLMSHIRFIKMLFVRQTLDCTRVYKVELVVY